MAGSTHRRVCLTAPSEERMAISSGLAPQVSPPFTLRLGRLTPGFTCCRKPQRRRSEGWRQSGASRGSAVARFPCRGALSTPPSTHARREHNDGRGVHPLPIIVPPIRLDHFADRLLPLVRGQAIHHRVKRHRYLPEMLSKFRWRTRPRPVDGAVFLSLHHVLLRSLG